MPLTYAMFPQVAPKFFEKRNAKMQGVDADHADYVNQVPPGLSRARRRAAMLFAKKKPREKKAYDPARWKPVDPVQHLHRRDGRGLQRDGHRPL